jgi:hypothetical protein
MAHSNRPLTSREFKIMLQTDHFMDRKKGIKEISTVIESLIEKQGGKFEALIKNIGPQLREGVCMYQYIEIYQIS